MSRTLRLLFLALPCLLVFALSCSTVAITDRRQLNLIPDGEMLAMSFSQYEQVIAESELSRDAGATAMVQRAGRNIQGAVERYFRDQGLSSELQGYAWEFQLIESEQVNAWCMPGGKVAFYSGILPVCEGETGVAVVMGHEIAHAIAEHGSERMSQGLLAQLGGAALSEALENKPQETQQLWLSAFGLGAQVGVLLPFSRIQESEADHLGLIFMAMAGYEPGAAADFWTRMSALGGAKPPEFLSTHPSDDARVRQIRAWLPEARSYLSR